MSEGFRLTRTGPAIALAALFLLTLVPQPVAANPGVPYCPGSVSPAPILAPPVLMPEVCEQTTGRVFPEASPLSIAGAPNALPGASTAPVLDYVSYYEFQAGLEYLAASEMGQKYLTIHQVAESVGLCSTAPGCADNTRTRFPIYMLELTNKESPIPLENRQSMLYMLSIHGNEKGGREGGFRVLEDLVKGIGFAAETVQDGAGMPTPLGKPTGGNVATYHDYLDFMRVFLLFPNADGWAHDELPFVVTDAPCTPFFCRGNGHGIDLNRQAPTLGWQDPTRNPVGEPESIGYYNWMLLQNITWSYAIDIHGMLNHQNFGAIMMPAGSMTPQEMQRSVRLAETLKQRLNDDPHFDGWRNLFTVGDTVQDPIAQALRDNQLCVGVPNPLGGEVSGCEGALNVVGSSEFANYYTVIDAIGYTDSGFNGDYFAQDTGLNAPGYDIELAYNHITTDSQYEGPGSIFNDYHVKMVREIVKSFMDSASLDVTISFETQGKRTLYLEPEFVATNKDDFKDDGTCCKTPGGWADENSGDDLYDYGTNGGFVARPAKYWEDLKPFVRDGDAPGVLVKATTGEVNRAKLDGFDTFVIPGSAIKQIEGNSRALADIKAWVEAGGNLVLTDDALRFFDLAGMSSGGVDVLYQYMGGIGMDLSKPVFYEYQDTSSEANRNVRGGVKQTVEPTPLGFAEGANAVPNWFVTPAALSKMGGESYGTACGTTSISDQCDDNGIGLGRVPLGQGQIQFIGSLLPDPTEEFYHPYGLDHYATTYSGNQILRNMLYWGNVLQAPPVVIGDDGVIQQTPNEPLGPGGNGGGASTSGAGKGTPGFELVLAGLAVVAVALARRR